MCASTGWTWEYLDEFVTLPRLEALQAHWKRYPPVHVSLAAFTGVKVSDGPAAPVSAARAPITNADVVRDLPLPRHAVKWHNAANPERNSRLQ